MAERRGRPFHAIGLLTARAPTDPLTASRDPLIAVQRSTAANAFERRVVNDGTVGCQRGGPSKVVNDLNGRCGRPYSSHLRRRRDSRIIAPEAARNHRD
jgi:hypothetical protein